MVSRRLTPAAGCRVRRGRIQLSIVRCGGRGALPATRSCRPEPVERRIDTSVTSQTVHPDTSVVAVGPAAPVVPATTRSAPADPLTPAAPAGTGRCRRPVSRTLHRQPQRPGSLRALSPSSEQAQGALAVDARLRPRPAAVAGLQSPPATSHQCHAPGPRHAATSRRLSRRATPDHRRRPLHAELRETACRRIRWWRRPAARGQGGVLALHPRPAATCPGRAPAAPRRRPGSAPRCR